MIESVGAAQLANLGVFRCDGELAGSSPALGNLVVAVKDFRCIFGLFLAATLDCAALATDILTSRGDNARTGLNSTETILNPTNVTSLSFGLVFNKPVDGQVYAQPLYVSKQSISGQSATPNVVIVATEHGSIYAFDADTGTQYWKTSLLPAGESPVQSNDPNISCGDIRPELGITATPVIDRQAGPNGTLFVVALSTNGANYYNRLHAVDLSSGQDLRPPIVISPLPVNGTGPATSFVATKQRGRPGLLLLHGIIYTAWGSYCDNAPYSGWIIAYNESDLSQASVLNTNPNGSPPSRHLPDGSGNGIWQDGNGPAADLDGTIYVATGNGPFDTNLTNGFPTNNDFGDSVLKLSSPSLSIADYFTPFNEFAEASADVDLGSGGPVVLPDIVDSNHTVHHLLFSAGKDSNVYLLDRDNLGHFNPNGQNNSQIYQELAGDLPTGTFSSAAYFNGSIYCGSRDHALRQFQFNSQAKLNSRPASTTATHFGYPGTKATISSDGNSNGIVWACASHFSRAVLHAYDATNLKIELYSSFNVNIGGAIKFVAPTVCNGKVYVGTSSSIAAFGLLQP